LTTCNQTPLLRGINDSPSELTALHRRLAEIGVAPYYVFHCRPAQGNERFMLSLQDGLRIVEATRAELSGLAKRFRYVGSHASGKIEIVGEVAGRLVLKYHEARDPQDENRVLTWPIDRPVLWFDEIVQSGRVSVTDAEDSVSPLCSHASV
jgi:lysine 2,3-aminomutase